MRELRSILNDLWALLSNITVRDVIDILMVALLFFLLFNMMRRSRSQIALRGLMIVLGVTIAFYLVTLFGQLKAMKAILDRLWVVIVLVFLIVFQNEFKKIFVEYGRLPFFRALFQQERTPIDEIVRAAYRLAEKNIGALICIERRTPLRSYIDTGTKLDAVISLELVRSIFTSGSPLHDGAVIVRTGRVAAAGCLLPLTDQLLDKDLGTRHRAAVGLAEETDALVIVVSEESGAVSLAVDGRLIRAISSKELHAQMREYLEIEDEENADGDS